MSWCPSDTDREQCLSWFPCLWCNDTSIINQCMDVDEYCDGTQTCNTTVIWGDWSKEEDINSCSDWYADQRGLVWALTMLFCVFPELMVCVGCLFNTDLKALYRITIVITMIFMIVLYVVLAAIITKNNVNTDDNVFGAWMFLFFGEIVLGLLMGAFVYFGIISFRWIITICVRKGKKSVHSRWLVLVYISWWILFGVLLSIIIYSVASHKEVIEALSFVSLSVIFLDLWHPIHEIQNEASDALLTKYCGLNLCNTCCDRLIVRCCGRLIARCCPETYVDYNNLSINEIEYKEQKENESESIQSNEQNECELKYWEFIFYVSWIILFVSLGICFQQYESCLFSLATFLPTFINILIFTKKNHLEMMEHKNVGCCVCVYIFSSTIGLSLTIFTGWSCVCNMDGDSGEWQHLAVIGTVVFFVFAHLHQKRRCLSDHSINN